VIRGVLDLLSKKLLNRALFVRYFTHNRGIIIEKDENGDWDVESVNAWDDASEAERRNDR